MYSIALQYYCVNVLDIVSDLLLKDHMHTGH